MRALLQRVTSARVEVAGQVVGAIDQGLLVLLGVAATDTAADADWLADRTLALRIFADDLKPMNRSVQDVGGGLLVVSQFTLMADTSRGRRPSFAQAAPPEQAKALYDHYVAALGRSDCPVATGIFAADMQVHLSNDGPVTILLQR